MDRADPALETPGPRPGLDLDDEGCILIAPDSYKGSLSSVDVAEALAAGWTRTRPQDACVLAPLADGGEGTLAAIHAAGHWRFRHTRARDPLGRWGPAAWLLHEDGNRAVVEMAAASGLSRIARTERDAGLATSLGTGDLLRAVLDTGVRDVTIGIGGSATTDGGVGFLVALGARCGADHGSVDLSRLDPRMADVRLRVACDVTNPLLGATGAAAVYGPQKGASPPVVAELEARLERWADALEAETGQRHRRTPGAGAAGGLGFALLCLAEHLRSVELRPGVDLVMEATGFDDALARAHLVLTGEGRIDAQTAFGKTALGVARRAMATGTPCIAVGGSVTPEGVDALAAFGAWAVPASDRRLPIEVLIAAGREPLSACAARLARDRRVTGRLRPGAGGFGPRPSAS